MHILVINQYYPPDASASAYLLGELTEDLAAGHDVHVVAGRPSYNPESSTYQPAGPSVTRVWSTTFDRSSLAGRAANYATFLSSATLAVLAAPRADVVMAQTDPPFVGMVAAAGARLKRTPFVFVCHDIYPDIAVALGRVQSRPVTAAWQRLNGLVRRHARRIVVVGRDMGEKLVREGVDAGKLVWLPNWASASPPSPAEVDMVRSEAGWDGRFVVMHAGNVGLAQRLEVLLDAADHLRAVRPELLFVVLGEGAGKRPLKEAAHRRGLDNLAFLPYVPKAVSERWMAAADVHVVSLAPGLRGCAAPSKLYSIMAAGRPFVAAVDEGMEPERVAREVGCGIWVPPGDGTGLAEALAGLEPSRAAEMGRRGREEFERRYSRSVVTDAYRRMLEEVVSYPAVATKPDTGQERS